MMIAHLEDYPMKTKKVIILKTTLILIILLFNLLPSKAQFDAAPEVAPGAERESTYHYAWAGGLNSCQFNQIDLNNDGTMDLLIFDRYGNRLLTFINQGIADSIAYQYAPAYVQYFPEISDWLVTKDYNLDGKADIFTYSKGFAGIKVYKNISSGDHPEFELVVFPFLKSFQGSGYVNILVTYADYPAIEDMDGDGDLDILTFWGLGSFVEFHKNMSMEKYGVPDSLDYEETQICWGRFAESDESNEIYLDTCVGGGKDVSLRQAGLLPHTGSTFLITDLDGDLEKDLLLGDVDFPTVVKLMNGGTTEDAYMISQTTAFPAGTRQVDLFSMPLAAYFDVDNDGIKELLVSPFDPGIKTSENFKSVWFYENEGTNNAPVFEFITDRFFQDNMIDVGSGAYPVFYDLDGDGLKDLFVGNYGYYDSSWYDQYLTLHSSYTGKLAYFRNTGTTESPAFQLWDRDYAALSALELSGIYPTFDDLDGDEVDELLIGNEAGTLILFKKQGGDYILAEEDFADIDVGDYSAPQLIDLDRDGLPDLVIGERAGNLNYYKNTGSQTAPDFELVTDSLGKVNVTDYNVSYDGFSTPFVFDHDGYQLIVGSEQGKIFYFRDIEENLSGKFTESDSLFALIDTVQMSFDEGMQTSATIVDLNQDEVPELIKGNWSGGLRFFGKGSPGVQPGISSPSVLTEGILIYPNPAKQYVYVELPVNRRAFSVAIRDMNGRKVAEFQPENSPVRLDLTEFEKGIYILEVTIENARKKNPIRWYEKLIKL